MPFPDHVRVSRTPDLFKLTPIRLQSFAIHLKPYSAIYYREP